MKLKPVPVSISVGVIVFAAVLLRCAVGYFDEENRYNDAKNKDAAETASIKLKGLKKRLADDVNAKPQDVTGTCFEIAGIYRCNRQFKQAHPYMLKALKASEKSGDPALQEKCSLSMAQFYFDWGAFENSRAIYVQILAADEKAGLKEKIGRDRNNLGVLYYNWGMSLAPGAGRRLKLEESLKNYGLAESDFRGVTELESKLWMVIHNKAIVQRELGMTGDRRIAKTEEGKLLEKFGAQQSTMFTSW